MAGSRNYTASSRANPMGTPIFGVPGEAFVRLPDNGIGYLPDAPPLTNRRRGMSWQGLRVRRLPGDGVHPSSPLLRTKDRSDGAESVAEHTERIPENAEGPSHGLG